MTLKERIAEKIVERESKMHGYYKSVFQDGYEGGYPESYDDDLIDFITTLLSEQKFDSGLHMPPQVGSPMGNGEWCSACGAWKTYGVADTHHCTGYKITC